MKVFVGVVFVVVVVGLPNQGRMDREDWLRVSFGRERVAFPRALVLGNEREALLIIVLYAF